MFKNFIYRIICGFLLGVSVFAPGFSGSVVAIVMGIYQDLLRIMANPFKDLKKNIIYCIPLGIGIAISGVLFILTFKYLFATYEKATYLLFIGLITGNIPVIYAEIKNSGFKAKDLSGGVIAFVIAVGLGIYALSAGSSDPTQTVSAGFLLLALSGIAGGVTALMPGMSVSMVLIITGVYHQLISMADSLLHFDFTYLWHFGLFGVCAVIAVVLTSRLIKMTFEKYPGFAYTTVMGFMLGSLIGILIETLQLSDPNFNWWLGALMLVSGIAVSLSFVLIKNALTKEE